MKLAIADLGCANIGAVKNAFERLGLEPVVTSDAGAIASADRVVLPGVGSAAFAMRRIGELGLFDCLRSLSQPVLGICLGMQLLFERSDEQDTDCLGIIQGRITKLQPRPGLPVPHMGWSKLVPVGEQPVLGSGDYFYFAHSYACLEGEQVIATADYGGPVAALVRSGNFLGAQFHPERSGPAGARFLEEFLQS